MFFYELGINNFPFLQVEFFNLGGVKVLAEVCLFLVLIWTQQVSFTNSNTIIILVDLFLNINQGWPLSISLYNLFQEGDRLQPFEKN